MLLFKKLFFTRSRVLYFFTPLLLAWMLFSYTSAMAIDNLQFEYISIAQGLSHGTVNDVLRDDDGFMWICTDDGLNRYDGYSIKHYKLPDVNRNILYTCMVKSDDGTLWFGTSIGLLCYIPEYDSLSKFQLIANVNPAEVHYNSHINSLFIDKEEQLWVGAWDGLYSVDLKGKKVGDIMEEDVRFYSSRESPENNKTVVMINSMAQDSKGLIWMTTSYPRLECYNPQNATFSSVDIDYSPIQNMGNILNKILIDKKDNIYIYTEGKGIVYWDRTLDTFDELVLKSYSGTTIDNAIVRTMMLDSYDNLWIGTDGHGFYVKNEYGITQYNTRKKQFSNINSDVIYEIYEDPEHNIWIGTYLAGLNKLSKSKTNFGLVNESSDVNVGLRGGLVFNFLEDHKGYIWIATDGGGLNRVDPKTNDYKHYDPDPSKKNAISTRTTIALFQDSNHDIWIGSYNGGLNRYNYSSDDFTTFYYDANDSNSICSNHPWGFAEDKYGNLWIASNSQGIDLKRRGSDRFINYSDDVNEPDESRILSSNALTHLLIDSRHYLWIGTEGGLDMIDLNKVDFSQDKPVLNVKRFIANQEENSLSLNRITYLEEGPYGNMWIGTKGGGLNQYLIEKDSFITYTVEDGLPHNIIQGIVFDNNKKAWLSTSYGLSVFDLETKTFENFSQEDGLQDNLFIKTSCYKTKRGELYFGGIKGFNAFFPSDVIKNNHPPQVKFTNFKLFNKDVEVGKSINDRVLIDRSLSYMDKIVLEYHDNFFSFEFSALDFTNPQKNQYAYMMEGFDESWVYATADNRKAIYTNLNPGDYKLKVKASNNNNVWNEEGASIAIEVLPPWWGAWWFRLLAIMFVVIVVGLSFYLRVRQLRHQKEKLRIMVDERTDQLREANESLKVSNATKDKFFSIIAHDVISPFNAIIGLTDLLKNKFHTLDAEKIENLIGLINRSSKQLHELFMNLLEWSRAERGSLSFNPEPLDMKNIIEKSVDFNSFVADNKGVNLEMDVSNFETLAYSDEQMIKTILRNLQSNAIKFTPEGGTIVVKAILQDQYFRVSVVDTGVGMDSETQKNILNPNEFLSTKGTNNESGTGLGLKLVVEFVAMQGGEMWIESEIGKGSEFIFTVPIVKG